MQHTQYIPNHLAATALPPDVKGLMGGCSVKRVSELDEVLDAIDRASAELSVIQRQIAERLAPVISPTPICDSKECARPPSPAPLIQRLRGIEGLLVAECRYMANIRDSLAL